jgi:predicted HicB family RNase H-like nuclease
VELRISGRDAELVYFQDPGAPSDADLGDDQLARISLRLPEQLKIHIDRAAAQDGVSTNSWIVRMLSHAGATGRSTQSRKRLVGYGRA